MLWSIECFDFNVLLFKEFCLLQFIECFKLLVSQKNNVCVCGCVVGVCVCVYIVIVKYFPCI